MERKNSAIELKSNEAEEKLQLQGLDEIQILNNSNIYVCFYSRFLAGSGTLESPSQKRT